MMIAAHAYIERGGTGERASILEALSGHVCRCTGYTKIVEAVGAAARGEVAPAEVEADFEPQPGEPEILVKGAPA